MAMASLFLIISIVTVTANAQPSSPGLITHADIRDAILTLVGATREQTGKLERHEMRERQLGDALTRTLSYIDARSRSQDKNIENLSVVIARMDNRIRKTEEMIMQRDERERIQMQRIMDNTVAIRKSVEDADSAPSVRSSGGGDNSDVLRKLTQMRKKIDNLDDTVASQMSAVTSEVKQMGANVSARCDAFENMHRESMEKLYDSGKNEAENLRKASVNLVAAESKWRSFFASANTIVDQFNDGVIRLTTHADNVNGSTIMEGIEKLQMSLDGSSDGNQSLSDILNSINRIENAVETELKPSLAAIEMKFQLEQVTAEGVANLTDFIEGRITVFEAKMADSQLLIQHQVEESAQMTETLAERVDKSYEGLAKEINGLSKVEQVLLETADGVLDTKRRLEFAVQQILLELGDSIRRQTGDLNSTLARKVEDVTFSVLANQSTALTNMTTKLESELGQVWRQIGVLYQSASVSQEMLQRVEQQTAQHVGGSLEALSSMDKRVGQVTERVNEVDDHLNYLLGRLSLVVQEFNQVRGGLGEALESLRSGLAVTGSKTSPLYDVSNTDSDVGVDVITRKEQLETHDEEDEKKDQDKEEEQEEEKKEEEETN